ncbi:MAG: HipA family kinase [Parvularcula sp.]|jgi:hypothetical protein|nr:HipA family kinase [Parvularcula sp.]
MAVHFPECEWRPLTIRRQINAVRSSTLVVEVETDSGKAFIKGCGNPAGDESLAFELVGTRLAKMIGLSTPEFAVLRHDFLDLVKFDGASMPFGPVFASKTVAGSTGGQDTPFLQRLTNPNSIPLLVAFDTWVANFDRCPPRDYLDPTPNWDNVFFVPDGRGFQLIVFDHTHCFAEGDLASALDGNGFRDDERVFGKFPEFQPFLDEGSIRKALQSILKVDVREIEKIIASVPGEWQISPSDRKEWLRQIDERRGVLEDVLLNDLSAQMRLKV